MGFAKRWSLVVAVVLLSTAAPAAAAPNPNASKIAFESDRENGIFAIFAMRPDGRGLVRLPAPAGAADAAWSPDGRRLAFEADPDGNGDPEIFVMDADGRNLRQLTNSPGNDVWPDWLPNGTQLVFNSVRNGKPDIYLMNVDGTGVRQLTDDPDAAGLHPQASRNGGQIVYSRETRTTPPNLWVMNVDGSGKRAVTTGPFADLDPVWSIDSRTIVFSSNRSGPSLEIFSVQVDGSNLRALTNTAGPDYAPAVSPDGKSVAWTKGTAGNHDVWVMNIDGSGKTRLTFDPTFEGFPDWQNGFLTATP